MRGICPLCPPCALVCRDSLKDKVAKKAIEGVVKLKNLTKNCNLVPNLKHEQSCKTIPLLLSPTIMYSNCVIGL